MPAFRTNLRRAVSSNRKLFFYDLGIRNILIHDFREEELRPDKGGLFENFILAEIEKIKKINNLKLDLYFYREYGGKEVDIVISDYQKNYLCLEIKSREEKVKKVFPLPHRLRVITPQNYSDELNNLKASLV